MNYISKKLLPIIVTIILIITLVPISVKAIDVQAVYGYIEFNNGVPVPSGVAVTLTNNNSGGYKTVFTYSGGVYTASVHGSTGNVLWVNVSFAANYGSNEINLDMGRPSQRCDVKISGNEIPIPSFNFTPTTPTNADVVYFYDNSSDPEDIQVSSWSWDFGDGTSSTVQNPLHRYLSSGTYTITLTVYDQYGAPNSTSADISVTNAPNNGGGPVITNSPPIAVIDATKKGYVNQTITFNANESYDTDGTITSYKWEFDDTTISNEIIYTHLFTTIGNYTVELTVNDEYGDEGSTTSYILIEEIPFKKMSNNLLIEINTKYNTTLVEQCYANDTDNNGILDNFTDPNKELTIVNTSFINKKPIFMISTNNDSIPEFFWNPNPDTITRITYQSIGLTSQIIDAENNTITYNITIDKKNWSYIETQNKHPTYIFEIKNKNNQTINNDKIWKNTQSIIFFDNTSDQYQIIYHYTILQPETKPSNLSKINNPKNSFTFKYNEPVKILNATLNNKNITLQTYNNKTYTYTPDKNLTEGNYKFIINVEDSENNTLISIFSYDYSEKESEVVETKNNENSQFPTIPIVLLLIAVIVISLFAIKKNKNQKKNKDNKKKKSKQKTKK